MNPLPIRLRRKALADIAEIRTWYRQIEASVEDRFVKDLNETLDRIQAFPFAYQVHYRETRRSNLARSPYGVYYLVKGSAIVILAVLHHKRDPRLARRRAE